SAICAGAPGTHKPGNLRAAMLGIHNSTRRAYGSAPLVWNAKLAADAAVWARKLASGAASGHDPQTGAAPVQGENLASATRGSCRPVALAQFWVDEKKFFQKGTFPNVSTTGNWASVGHYTQIIWPGTRQIGCALRKGARFDFLVCRYLPSGNAEGTVLK
ncbi:CAP domain-containing protein, partial [Sphingomonas sp.]|uniref:CAP domain-containing protein n=1 Tax=Sphingomonas sp. TaxID=28214 RepID=UPI001D1B375C